MPDVPRFARPFLVAVVLAILALAARSFAEEVEGISGIKWTPGPTLASLGNQAEIQLPEGYIFTGPKGTKTFMELNQNPVSGAELGIVMPMDSTAEWFALYVFDESGYVKDDEKTKLDADKILANLREGTKHANEERKKRGWGTLEIVGWQTPPRYNEETHNLEWAVIGESEGGRSVNYSTRLLGRHGVMKTDLVCSPEALERSLPQYEAMMTGFHFTSGHGYAEYQKGDKLASYGLTALIAGGAGVALAKSGLLAKLWKLILVVVVAIGSAISRLFKRNQEGEAPPQA